MVSALALFGLVSAPINAVAAGARPDPLPYPAPPGPAPKAFDPASITLREVGARNTMDWRIWVEKDGKPISPWHDIPLYPDEKDKNIVNFYVEIPRWSDGKVETSRNEPLNPILHDVKDNKPRFVTSVWPNKAYPFHYGSLPQTWENSNVKHNFTGFIGDNDPMDIIDISAVGTGHIGQIRKVKILGGLAMIDSNTTDWKVLSINTEDPLSKLVNSVEDLEQYRPGVAQAAHDWFVYYKVVRSGTTNQIQGNKFEKTPQMIEFLEESHNFWKDLVSGKENPGKISIKQTSQPALKNSYVRSDQATKLYKIPAKAKVLPPAARPEAYDRWYYLDKDFKLRPAQDIPNLA